MLAKETHTGAEQ